MEWNEQDMQQNAQPRPRPQRPDGAPARRRPPQGDTQQRRPRPAGAEGTQQRRPRPAGAEGTQQRRPRPADAEGTQQRRPRPADAEGTQQRRPRPAGAEGTQQRRPRPAGAEGTQQRRPRPANADGTRSAADVQRRAAQQGSRRRPQPAPEREAASDRKESGRKLSKFRVGMALYVCVFFLATLYGMHVLWNYLNEFEQSRPEHTIEAYITHLSPDFYSQMTQQSIGTAEFTPYETADSIVKSLGTTLPESGTYSWGRKGDTYTDEKPDYYIRYGDAAIAHVVLNQEGKTPKYGFPVWHAGEPVSLIEISAEPAYSVDVTVPQGASISLNGIPVQPSALTAGTSNVTLDEVASQITAQPAAQSFVQAGLFAAPSVTAADAAGNPLTLKTAPAETDKAQKYVFVPADENAPPEELIQRATALTKAYVNYMINERERDEDADRSVWENLSVLQQYLVADSTAYKMLRSLTGDVYWNNKYISREDRVLEVRHVKMYSDTVCTLQTHFEIQLVKNVSNDYTGTVEWTMVKNDAGVWNACGMELIQDGNTEAAPEQTPAETPEG